MKKTKREMFQEILKVEDVANNDELVEFINHEIEMLSKKKSSGAATAKQKENEDIKKQILDILQASGPKTITEIANELENNYSNQKISALTSQLVRVGSVNRTIVKKVAYFTIV